MVASADETRQETVTHQSFPPVDLSLSLSIRLPPLPSLLLLLPSFSPPSSSPSSSIHSVLSLSLSRRPSADILRPESVLVSLAVPPSTKNSVNNNSKKKKNQLGNTADDDDNRQN